MLHANMQMVSHHYQHNFWEKETLSSKLPYLDRDVMSRQRSPSGTHHNYRLDVLDHQEEKMSSMRDTQRPWQHPANIHRRKHTYVEEQNEYVPSRRAPDKLFPLKPVLHKRAYSLSNVSKPEHYPRLPSLTHQAAVRHQQTGVRQLDGLNQHLTERNKKREEQHEQTWLSRDIQSKEMMLQQKIFKAEETMRRVQKERNKSYYEKQKEDRFYSNGYGDWDEEMERCGNRQDRWEREVNGGRRARENEKCDARGRPLTPEMVKGHRVEERREREECEYKAKDWDREKRNGRRERVMGLGNDIRRRREIHRDGEDEVLWDARNPNSSDLKRRDRSHLQHETRGDGDGLYELTSRLMSMKCGELNPSQRGNRLQQGETEESSDATLVPCDVCHRSFARGRLETHMRVCANKRPQRKVFDMFQHRTKGTEIEAFMKTKQRSKTPELKKIMWRQKHEALIQTLRQGRSAAGQQPQPVPSLHPEYVTCPHCSRRFAPGPAERHIPKCQNIKSRPPPPAARGGRAHTDSRRDALKVHTHVSTVK